MMEQFKVREEYYDNICTVHKEVEKIFDDLKEVLKYGHDNVIDLVQAIEYSMIDGLDFVAVATKMGQNMEDAIKDRNQTIENLKEE